MIEIVKSIYEIQELLSEDLLVLTYKGRHQHTHRSVLIFEYKSEYVPPEMGKILITTSETLLTIDSPHCLKLLDYDYDGQAFYAIYDFVHDMETVKVYLQENKTITLKDVYHLSLELLQGMMEIDALGLRFGYLNLSMIYITPDHKVKLANSVFPGLMMQEVIKQFSVIDECILFSPEFLLKGEMSVQSDIYSFGMLLYYLYASSWPYKNTSRLIKMKANLLHNPRSIEHFQKGLPSQIVKVIHKCIQKDKAQRFASFDDVRDVYLNQKPIEKVTLIPNRTEIEEKMVMNIKTLKFKYFKKWFLRITVAFFLFLMLALSYGAYMGYVTSIPEVEIPDVLGLTQEEGEEIFINKGLKSTVAGFRYHMNYPEGTIIETKPNMGRLVKQNREISVILSKGESFTVMPDLIGRTKDQTEAILNQDGLDFHIIGYDYSYDLQKGLVSFQDVTPNERIRTDVKIGIKLSQGYPVVMSTRFVEEPFFDEVLRYYRTKIVLQVEPTWPTQNVSIYVYANGNKKTLYEETLYSSEEDFVEYHFGEKGIIEVYYNEELALKQSIALLVVDPQEEGVTNNERQSL